MPDTIAAIATAPAAAAVGIVRLSGAETRRVLAALFTPVNGRSAAELPPRRMTYGTVRDAEGRTLDHALAVVFSAGHSYTGEESAELHCHGSPVVLQEVLRAAFAAGARQARAGEFTERAFLNGKMDLTEAEAVIDLIDAETAEAARNAAAQVDGALRRPLEQVYDALLGLTSRFYAVVDYPDEDIEDLTLAETERTLTESEQTLAALLGTFARGRVLKSGAATAIVGAPNAGKSSLLNALVGYDRAIVTDLPGTTRDTVEEKAVVGGVLLRLIDTAGIRETDDAVERLGVERSRRAVESADLVIVVADGSHTPLTVEPDILALAAQAPHWILAISKDDRNPAVKTAVWRLPDGAPAPEHLVSFNSVMPGGLDALIDTIGDCFPAGVPAGGTLLTNARQAEAIRRALESVRAAREALTAGLTPDVVLTEAEGALDALGELLEAVAPLVDEVVVVEVLGDDDVQHGHAERGIGAAHQRKLPAAAEKGRTEQRADHSAVESDAALPDGDNLLGMDAVVVPGKGDIVKTRSHNRGEHRIKDHICDPVAVDAELSGTLDQGEDAIIERYAQEQGYAKPNERVFVDISGK